MSEDDSCSENICESGERENTNVKEEFSSYKYNTSDESNGNFLDSNLNEDESSCAPVEVLSEFLSTFMSHDYISALYYCKIILLYEPENEIVQDFYPIILEKLYLNSNESDEFADNEASFSTKSEHSSEYFSNLSAGTENNSACSSLSSDEEYGSNKSSL